MSKRVEKIGTQRFGHLVDFSRPIEFTLNGRTLNAFHGDTLYSALIANDMTEVIGPLGESFALTRSLPLFARYRGAPSAQTQVLAADLVLSAGDDLEVAEAQLGALSRLTRYFKGQKHTPLALNWAQNSHFDLPLSNSLTVKTVIVGGGISGMKAAIEIARTGQDVLLLEKEQMLGGICAYYGKSADETEPVELVETLAAQILDNRHIRVFAGTKALDIREKSLLVQHSHAHEHGQRTALRWVHFDQLVIATGGDHHGFALENRLPHRVLDSKEAFQDLWAYGLVRFDEGLLYTLENGAFRYAMHLQEAGIDLLRAFDGRPSPNSRHIEFAKAVGVKLGFAVRLQSVVPKGDKVQLHFSPTHIEAENQRFQFETRSLILGYPPQPDNYFWVKAGGESALDTASDRFLPDTGPAHIAIVGTAAGYSSQIDCLASVDEALSRLGHLGLSNGAAQVNNPQMFETPAAYRYKLPDLLRRRNAAFYNFPEATNYYLRALPLTDQTLRQYFANGYFHDNQLLRPLSTDIPGHYKHMIENGQFLEIHPKNEERLRIGQMLFIAGQEQAAQILGVITHIEDGRILAYCNGERATSGLNISVKRRNGLTTPAQIGGSV